jgi:hypothetical protein
MRELCVEQDAVHVGDAKVFAELSEDKDED